MNSEEFRQEIEELSQFIEGLDNNDVIFTALSNLNRSFIHSMGAGPVPAKNPSSVHGQTIACNNCGHTMTVK